MSGQILQMQHHPGWAAGMFWGLLALCAKISSRGSEQHAVGSRTPRLVVFLADSAGSRSPAVGFAIKKQRSKLFITVLCWTGQEHP